MAEEVEVVFSFRMSALPYHLQRELELIGVLILQLDQMEEDSRKRVLAYINAAYS